MCIDKNINKAKERIKHSLTRSKSIYGEFNANRLRTYPNALSIKFDGECMKCKTSDKLYHFDNDVHLCENCASDNGLIDLFL